MVSRQENESVGGEDKEKAQEPQSHQGLGHCNFRPHKYVVSLWYAAQKGDLYRARRLLGFISSSRERRREGKEAKERNEKLSTSEDYSVSPKGTLDNDCILLFKSHRFTSTMEMTRYANLRDPSSGGGGKTALAWAARNGHLELVRFLSDECGCSPNIVDDR